MKYLICIFAIIAISLATAQETQERQRVQKLPSLRRRGGPHINLSRRTPCIEAREKALKSRNVAQLIPECGPDGNFLAKQCHGLTTRGDRFCQCWRDDGTPMTQPSRRLSSCECIRERDNATRLGILVAGRRIPAPGTFIPECERDGNYKKLQCHGSTGMCWCVSPNGRKLTQPSRGNVKC